MMATIVLLRHAQASFGSDNYDKLSALGHRQAKIAAEYLQPYLLRHTETETPNDVIGNAAGLLRCGTLLRQRETAAALVDAAQAKNTNSPDIVIDARLDEIDHERQFNLLISRMLGSEAAAAAVKTAARRSSRDYQKLLKRVFAYWQESPDIEGLESWVQFSHRISAFLRELITESRRGQSAVIVTSGGVIAGIVQQVLNLPPSACYSLYEPLRNCSITRLLHDGQRVSLSSYNDSSYLETLSLNQRSESLLTYR